MQNITFELRPYYNGDESMRTLTLLVDGEVKADRPISFYWWSKDATQKDKDDEMSVLVRYVSNLEHNLLHNKACFTDANFYQKWYEYEFFIDGEDAREFIVRVPRTRHSTQIQSAMAVKYGWRYYKCLRAHDFREQVCADLAYWRGYLAGMDLNAPWDAEGTEAIRCMDLNLEEGKKHAYD